MITATQEQQRGFHWTPCQQLEDITFADDVALISHRYDNMEDKVIALDRFAPKLALRISKEKSRSMIVSQSNSSRIKL